MGTTTILVEPQAISAGLDFGPGVTVEHVTPKPDSPLLSALVTGPSIPDARECTLLTTEVRVDGYRLMLHEFWPQP